MSERPWFKFYPDQWLADTGLQTCSCAARGLWISMIAIMHSGKARGHLCRPNGETIDVAALASLAHLPEREARKLVAELRRANVFSVTENGTIFSRKMVRDETRSQRGRETGRMGGNPRITGKVVPLRSPRPLTTPLRGGLNPHCPLSSPGEQQVSQEEAQEGSSGGAGPFTDGGEAA